MEVTTMPKKSRYRPQVSGQKTLRLDGRDYEIVRLVYEHRFLDTELLLRLLRVAVPETAAREIGRDGKHRPARYGFGQKALYRRLQILFHGRVLNRYYLSDEPVGRGYGGPRAIYGLGPRSAAVLAETHGVDPRNVSAIIESNKVKSPFLRHSLLTARFRVMLELGCALSNGNVKLLFWSQGQHLRDFVSGDDEHGVGQRFTVYPDALFALEIPGRKRANYVLEIDRGTEPLVAVGNRSDIRKKLLGYWHYRRSRRFVAHYRYELTPGGDVVGLSVLPSSARVPSVDDTNPALLHGFTVLFCAPGSVSESGSAGGRIANILALTSTLGHSAASSGLFWYAPLDRLDLEKPWSILQRVWITSNPKRGLQSLIE
jgi:hypothetical protein